MKSAVGKPAVSGYGATYATGHARIFGPKPPRPTCNRCADPAACAAGCRARRVRGGATGTPCE
jgi:hypothetical protein